MKTPIEFLESQFNKWSEGKVFIPKNILEAAKRLEKEHIIIAVNINEHRAVDFCNNEVFEIWNVSQLFDVDPDAGINYYNEIYNENE